MLMGSLGHTLISAGRYARLTAPENDVVLRVADAVAI